MTDINFTEIEEIESKINLFIYQEVDKLDYSPEEKLKIDLSLRDNLFCHSLINFFQQYRLIHKGRETYLRKHVENLRQRIEAAFKIK